MSSSPSDNTVTQHPLQDVDLNASTSDLADGSKNVNKKENWVKFDDDVNEGILGTSENNNNNRNELTAIAATTNRLTPPPTNPKRQSTAAVGGAATRSLTPTLESSQQQLHASTQLDVTAATPVQRTTVMSSTSSVLPDVAAPAVLNTESVHVNLNASGKAQQQQQLNTQNLQQHHQKPKTLTSNSSNNIVASATASSSNNSNSTQQHQHQHHQNNQLPHHSNNGNMTNSTTNKLSMSTTTTGTSSSQQQPSTGKTSVTIPIESQPPMRTIELSTGRIREGFANGDVIVTLLPANTKFPWVTPAIFRPELVPEELMAQGLTLTVEEYVHAMETLVNDYRFTMYNICYKRILVCWILFAFSVLLTLLFSGLQGVALFSLGVGWLFLNAAAIFLCMWVKLRLARGLEKCLARVNKQLIKHKILLILDDRGRISCHKVNLCFLYFDSAPCVSFLNEFLEHTEQNGGEAIKAGWEAKLDIDVNDIVIQGSNPVRLSRKQAVAQELYLSYLQRWGKDFLRRRLDWTVQEAGVHETPRHLQSSICPCQYEEEERGIQLFLRYASRWGRDAIRGLVDVTPLEPGRHCGQFQCPCQYIKDHLQCKPRGKLKCFDIVYWVLASERYPCGCIAYASDPQFQNRY
ncbi:hypothetical protein CVS40_10970 [Lucilia cuprina]|nr:hypothetical protein CVS40_10970 [Lucilia cuprina]